MSKTFIKKLSEQFGKLIDNADQKRNVYMKTSYLKKRVQLQKAIDHIDSKVKEIEESQKTKNPKKVHKEQPSFYDEVVLKKEFSEKGVQTDPVNQISQKILKIDDVPPLQAFYDGWPYNENDFEFTEQNDEHFNNNDQFIF